MSESEAMAGRGSVGRGFVLALILNIGFQLLAWVVFGLGTRDEYFVFFQLGFFGATQWLYLLPCLVVLYRRKQFDSMKGVWLAGGIGLLASGACWGFVML